MRRNLNLGIVAHVDAGKTTLSETLLYLNGRIRKAGRVDHGDTHLDTDLIEKDRGITIFSKQARLELPDLSVTLLDTPGHTDFSAETERTLQILDAAVLLISGTDGVQSHTATLWRLLEHYHVPVLLFVNKMDLEGADRERLMKELRGRLSDNCVDFSAAEWMEEAASTDERLLDLWIDGGELPDAEIARAVGERKLFPAWFGSALRMEGVQELLDGAMRFAPVKAPKRGFGMRVYKIGRDPQGARLTYVRITGGTLRVRDAVTYSAGGETLTEKADQIRLYTGERFDTVQEASAGTVCAVTGLTATVPGMGIGEEENAEEPLLEPVMTRKMILPQGVHAADFFRKIRVLEEEEPTLHIVWDEAGQEINVQIMGQVQIEVLTRMIRERFGTAVTFGKERITYKETVTEAAEGVGHYEPLKHYAEVHLLLERGERGSGVTVASACSQDELDLNWQRLILTHVMEREHPGVLTGSPLTDVRITLLAGRAHKKHTEGGDFRQATYRAIRHGLKRAAVMLLEPWYAFALEIPQTMIGKAISDLESRCAEYGEPVYSDITGEENVRIEGTLPVSESGDFMTEVLAYSGGRGILTLTLSGYRECHNAEEMIERIGYQAEADVQNPTGSVFCAHGAGFYVPWDQVETWMHIPYVYTGDADPEPEGENGVRGFRSALPETGRSAGLLTAEEDSELSAIYAREFGRTRDGAVIGDDRSRRRWKRGAGEEKTAEIRVKTDKHGNPVYPAADTRKPLLIVDGYNIIFAWEDLRELAGADIGAARGKLLDLLSNYQGFTGRETIVVFDAWRTDRNPESVSKYQNLTVIYTKENQTADAWIERTVHERIGKSNITVATSDGMEQLTVMRLGALRMSAAMLREEMGRVSREAGFSTV